MLGFGWTKYQILPDYKHLNIIHKFIEMQKILFNTIAVPRNHDDLPLDPDNSEDRLPVMELPAIAPPVIAPRVIAPPAIAPPVIVLPVIA